MGFEKTPLSRSEFLILQLKDASKTSMIECIIPVELATCSENKTHYKIPNGRSYHYVAF